MYIVKISQFELDFEFSELLMMQFELEICSDLISFSKFWPEIWGNLEKSRKFP